MACNCGGGIQRMIPKEYLAKNKNREIFKPKPSVLTIPRKEDISFSKIFIKIEQPTDLLKFLPTEKVIYFISVDGSAESNYLKTFLPRVLLTHITAKMHLKYYEISTCNVLAPKISKAPATVFINRGNLYSTYAGIFDFKHALNSFLAI